MKEVINVLHPLLNNIEGHPFVLGPQGPYNSVDEAKQGLVDFYDSKGIPDGQPVIVQGKWFIYKASNDTLVYFCTSEEFDIIVQNINKAIKQNTNRLNILEGTGIGSIKNIILNEINKITNNITENIYFLGNFSSAGEAENAAKDPNISGNNNIIIIRFTIDDKYKQGIIIQQVGDYRTVQYYIWDACIYTRHIWFTNNTRTTINTGYNSNWWKLGGTHIKYNSSTRKIGLENMNNGMMNESNTAVLPLANETVPGLISGENIKTINNQSIFGQGNIEIKMNSETSGENINITTEPTLLPYKYLGMDVYEHLVVYPVVEKEDYTMKPLSSKLGITISKPIIISANFISFNEKNDTFKAIHYNCPIKILINENKCMLEFDYTVLTKNQGSLMGYSDDQTMYIRLIYADGSQR